MFKQLFRELPATPRSSHSSFLSSLKLISRIFFLLYFLHLSLIHLIFEYAERYGSNFIFFQMDNQLCQHHLSNPTEQKNHFMLNFPTYQDLFLKFQSIALIDLSLFMPISYRCDYSGFIAFVKRYMGRPFYPHYLPSKYIFRFIPPCEL